MNEVTLAAEFSADPEVRYLLSGDVVLNIRLATTDHYKASDKMKEATKWHRVSFFAACGNRLGIFEEGSSAPSAWEKSANLLLKVQPPFLPVGR